MAFFSSRPHLPGAGFGRLEVGSSDDSGGSSKEVSNQAAAKERGGSHVAAEKDKPMLAFPMAEKMVP
ncbi:hypothetical protein E2562_023830 [Oryza meyeriana var. granulata]|uniref:Uncharacterized protein n=1 Tax=Oryza meyeriana var. granulata TaxID=110450 RepID=A0A6G1D5U6_9ORYZ|nr:hypothetical protein E2562_023830 [Oryza meyeriana var. granulata]